MVATTPPRIVYNFPRRAHDTRIAVLWHGEQRGWWRYLALDGQDYIIEFNARGIRLAADEVDELMFNCFMGIPLDTINPHLAVTPVLELRGEHLPPGVRRIIEEDGGDRTHGRTLGEE